MAYSLKAPGGLENDTTNTAAEWQSLSQRRDEIFSFSSFGYTPINPSCGFAPINSSGSGIDAGTPSTLAQSGSQTVLVFASNGELVRGASGGPGGGGSNTAVSSLSSVSVGSAGGLVINLNFDSSVAKAPSGFTAAVTAAAQYYSNMFTDPITIAIDVGYGEVDGQSLGSGALGESLTYISSYNYSQVTAALRSDAKSADDTQAVGTLSSSDPTGGGNFWVSTAEAKALGLSAGSGAVDGYIGLSSGAAWTYDPGNRAVAGDYDFLGTVEHEISEVLGRAGYAGQTVAGAARSYSVLDLFRYSGAGSRQLGTGSPAYFSLDGGLTNLDNFNTNSGGDYGDWGSSAGNDSYNAFSSPGVANIVTGTDLRVLDVLGWDRVATQSSSPTPAPTPSPIAYLQFVGTGDTDADGLGDIAFSNGAQAAIWLNTGSSF
jgi:hypothetical protein